MIGKRENFVLYAILLLAQLQLDLQVARGDQDVWPGIGASIVSALTSRARSISGRAGGQSTSGETILDSILLDMVPEFLGYPASNKNGTAQQFRQQALKDTSNDNATRLTNQELIQRSGFKYANHYVISDDGYITELIRIINPKASKKFLKKPPVMLFHGGIVDPGIWIFASSIQHHPEPWPRTKDDGPMTSSNRSLAFFLSNSGYDVWLVGTRGSNAMNQNKNFFKSSESFIGGKNKGKNMTLGENFLQLSNSPFYWRYTMDNIIEHELKNQINRVLQLTRSKNVTIMVFSYSTMTSLPFLGMNPEFAANKIHNYIVMAPIVTLTGTARFWRFLVEEICLNLPEDVGTILLSDLILSQPTRDLITEVARSKQLRYLLAKFFLDLFAGSSAKYRSNLELNVINRVLQPVSFVQVKHSCQQAAAGHLQKYDFGRVQNLLIYNQEKPPVYDISNITVKNWLLISGATDNLATIDSVRQVLNTVQPKPYYHVQLPGFNHVDLITAFDNDKQVNEPILNFLDKFAIFSRIK